MLGHTGNPIALFCELSLRSQNARHLRYSKKQPLAATWPQVAASGRKWPQVAASGRKWPQVAASGRWPQVAASGSGRTWPVALLVGFEISRAASLAAICIICSHLQPLACHSSGRKWPQVAASGRKWLQVAASGRKWLLGRQIPARMAPPLKT